MKEQHEDYPSILEAFFLIVGLFGAEYLVAAALHDITIFAGSDQRDFWGVIEILGYGLLFSALLGYKRLTYRDLFHQSQRSVATTIALLGLPILAVIPAIILATSSLLSALEWFFPMSHWEEAMFERMMSSGLATVVTVCIIAPVLEEMLFRGIILRSFLRQYTPGRAILVSALLFGLAHLNIYQFVAGALIGLLLGWLYERTRSLWPGILLHAVYNSALTAISLTSDATNKGEFSNMPFTHWLAVFAIAFAATTLMIRLLGFATINKSK
jgi:membrane protease YdiL (CAAX protease family)